MVQKHKVCITCYKSELYRKLSKNHENQSKVWFASENRSHAGGKLSVYTTIHTIRLHLDQVIAFAQVFTNLAFS